MKNKLYYMLTLIGGIALLLFSLIKPVYQTLNANIIGGADWPVLMFYFREHAWLFIGGLVIVVVSLLAMKNRK